MKDKWDREVERLQKMPLHEVQLLWYMGDGGHTGSILFDPMITAKDEYCGCPVQAWQNRGSYFFRALYQEVKDFLNAQRTFPQAANQITHEILPLFAKIQRLHAESLNRKG